MSYDDESNELLEAPPLSSQVESMVTKRCSDDASKQVQGADSQLFVQAWNHQANSLTNPQTEAALM